MNVKITLYWSAPPYDYISSSILHFQFSIFVSLHLNFPKEKPAAHAAGFNFTKCRECYSLFSASRRALFAAITFSCTGTGASS